MQIARKWLAVPLGLAAAIGPWGCGRAPTGDESTVPEAKVTGKVTVKGRKATRGEVRFNPSTDEHPAQALRTADIGRDGTYELTTLVGENRVSVTTPEIEDDPELPSLEQPVQVQAGDNTIDIRLPPASSP